MQVKNIFFQIKSYFYNIFISFYWEMGYNTTYMPKSKEGICMKGSTVKSTSMNTHMGNIIIDNEVIAQYAGSVAVECFGIVGMAGVNVKDGLVRLLKMDSITRGINVSINNNKLTLNFHVIVAYGVSIVAVSENLMSNVKYKVEEFTGMEIEKINIFVEGVRVID